MNLDVVAKVGLNSLAPRNVHGGADRHAQPVGNEDNDVTHRGFQTRCGKGGASADQRRHDGTAACLGTQPAADRPHFNAAAAGFDASGSRDLMELHAATASLGFELAVALVHNDRAGAGLEYHGFAVANAQAPTAGTGGNSASRRVDMNAAAAGGHLNVASHFADLDTAAAALGSDGAANLIEIDAAAAGGHIHSAVQSQRGNGAAFRLQHHEGGLRRRLDLEIDVTVAVAFTFRAEQGNLAGAGRKPDLVEFAARCLFRANVRAGAHMLANDIAHFVLLRSLDPDRARAGNYLDCPGCGKRAVNFLDPFVAGAVNAAVRSLRRCGHTGRYNQRRDLKVFVHWFVEFPFSPGSACSQEYAWIRCECICFDHAPPAPATYRAHCYRP